MLTPSPPRVARSRRRGLLAILAGLAVCVGLTAESPQAAAGRPAAAPAGSPVARAPHAPAQLPAPAGSRPALPVAGRPQLPAAEQRTAYPNVAASSAPSGSSAPAPASPADAAPAARHSAAAERSPVKRATKASSTPSKHKATASGSSWSAAAGAVLAQLNAERSAHGLRALRTDSRLVSSAHTHNLAMAAHNQMSHQLPGEAWFADRILAAGYPYVYAGENVGWNSVRTVAGALQLETMMYTEKPPNDGHRQNILSAHYTQIGVDVYVDPGTGKIWLTEDFGSRS